MARPGPGAPPARGAARRRAVLVLCALVVAAGIAGLMLGTEPLSPHAVLAALLDRGGPAGATARVIVVQLRLPRVVLAALVGGGLAESGAVLQGLFRNPLADPGLLGISAGAGFAVVLATTLHVGQTGMWTLPACGFLGAVAAAGLVYATGSVHGRAPVLTLLLAGVAVATLFGAGITLLLTLQPLTQVQSVFAWLYGSLDGALWSQVAALAPVVVVGGVAMYGFARELNLIATDEPGAAALGVGVERVKRWLLLCVALVTGACVAVSGPVAFVGLIVPHILRRLVGADHRMLLPSALLGGAAFLIAADLAGRSVAPPAEINLGVVTAFIGVPFFVHLLRHSRSSA